MGVIAQMCTTDECIVIFLSQHSHYFTGDLSFKHDLSFWRATTTKKTRIFNRTRYAKTKLKFKTGEAEPLRGHSATPHQPQAQLGSLAPS